LHFTREKLQHFQKRQLKSFLGQIHEVVQNKVRIDAWCAALSISQPILDPGSATINDIASAIENRDKEIRADLVEFVKGQRARADVTTPFPLPAANLQPSPEPAPFTVVGPVGVPPAELADEGPDTEVESDVTINGESVTDVGGLSAAYNEDSDVHLILDHFANRQRNRNVTEIEALLDTLARASTPSEKVALIRAFRRLDALGVGRFVTGRRGHPTRFEWREKSLTVRDLALQGGREKKESELPGT
jgi:hypothetical protein